MKKKIALLLAAAMTLSLLPMNVFAASSNSLTGGGAIVPEDTLMAESSAPSGGTIIQPGPAITNDDTTVEYVIAAPELKIELKDTLASGSAIKLILENADWFFRDPTTTTDYPINARTGLTSTYDTTLGTWTPDTAPAVDKRVKGRYERFGTVAGIVSGGGPQLYISGDSVPRNQVGYFLDVERVSPDTAVVTFPDGGLIGEVILIPLVSLTTSDKDVKIRIDNGNVSAIASGTYTIGVASGTLTKTTVKDPVTARDKFPIERLTIAESRFNSIQNGWFEIKAPTGFYFNNKTNFDGVVVGVESGLAWYRLAGDITGDGTDGTDYDIKYRWDEYSNERDYTTVQIHLKNVVPSTRVTGKLYIEGLEIYAEENAPAGDIFLTVRNFDASKDGSGIEGYAVSPNGDVLSEDLKVKAGTKTDWTIILKTLTDVPTLVNGRYGQENPSAAIDGYHKTAKVQFSENSVAAWWSQRYTVFTLPEQVKFRKVDITDAEEIDEADDLEGVYYNTGKRDGYVTINGNTMTWQNLNIKKDKKALTKFDIWVSIESGFEGDVTLGVQSSITNINAAVPSQAGEVPPIVIAKAVNPVSMTTKVTDVKIGYQYQATADITLTENAAGYLLRNKEVRLSVSDMISADMILFTEKKPEITAGDLKISNLNYTFGGYARATSGSLYGSAASNTDGGTLRFKIDQPSTKASTIEVKGLAVKLDRGVPQTNYEYYKAVAWGSAIAENFGARAYNDTFDTPGIFENYVYVISAAPDKTSVLEQEVRVAIGENYYTVDGVTYDMDAAAYISPVSNSTMVPVRFVANAFGIKNEQIIWDNDNKVVTIIHPNGKIIQFTIGSQVMVVNSVNITMFSPDMKPVTAEIKGDIGHERTYIPFRALGEAFGVPVTWDGETQTAIYNEGATTNKFTSQTNAAE